jgi:hypothetical protein
MARLTGELVAGVVFTEFPNVALEMVLVVEMV